MTNLTKQEQAEAAGDVFAKDDVRKTPEWKRWIRISDGDYVKCGQNFVTALNANGFEIVKKDAK